MTRVRSRVHLSTRRRRAALTVGALLAGLAALPASPAQAYNPRHTHPWIAREAVRVLTEAYPGRYDELLAYVDDVAEGAEHEDDIYADGDTDPLTLRVMRHFFRPSDRQGLTIFGDTFPNSYEWGIVGSEGNRWDWTDGLAAYADGDRQEAYYVLGHVVHLVQDLTVPAHTHLDQHGPPAGDDYEGFCSSMSTSEFLTDLPVPPRGAAIPEFDSPLALWLATARASYNRNLYDGRLSGTEASGDITRMFPSLEYSQFSQTWGIDNPNVGDLGDGFFEREPDLFYFKTTRYPAEFDVDTYDPRSLSKRMADNRANQAMAELFARDLMPVAILHSAALMKMYLDEAYALAPPGGAADAGPGADAPSPTGCSVSAAGRANFAPFALLFASLLSLALLRRKRCPA